MYAKLPFGTLFALLGVAAAPGASPPVQAARALLALAGAGFGIYLIFFTTVLLARFRLRRPATGERRAR
jgi:heme A synthase